ncbi:hypothetical protein CRE_16812 [Caenorhabditis remanei]|uniref:Uncharacterized protein n=1 Tax=Caenorhabditis remanei TaxID=31234 RepID=E3MAL3_CAERE|nr:hypothetical protein CRE_16812 [Caenorhabditis remanei]
MILEKANRPVQLSSLLISFSLSMMQNKHDLHLVYHGDDHQVVQFNKSKTGLERIFASEMTHDINFCRFIRKLEVVNFEVTIYGKNKREGDFKLIVEPAKPKKIDNKNQSMMLAPHVIEPPSVWIGNPQRGIFRFMVKLQNETLMMKMDDDTDWFAVLYYPKSVEYYNMRLSLCKTIRSVMIVSSIEKNNPPKINDPHFNKLYDSKKLNNECPCLSRRPS